MTSPSHFLQETGNILGLPTLHTQGAEIVGITFAGDQVVSLDFSGWPSITLYRSIALPVLEDLTAYYLRVMALNAELDGPTLASDEGGALHLIHTLNAAEHTAAEFATLMEQFAILGADLPRQISASDEPIAIPAPPEDPRDPSHAVEPAMPADARIYA